MSHKPRFIEEINDERPFLTNENGQREYKQAEDQGLIFDDGCRPADCPTCEERKTCRTYYKMINKIGIFKFT